MASKSSGAGYCSTFSHSFSFTFSVTFYSLLLLSPVFLAFVLLWTRCHAWQARKAKHGRPRTPYQHPARPTGQQFLQQWCLQLLQEQERGIMVVQNMLLYCLLMWGLCLQQLWPVAPLFHCRSCMTSQSLCLDNSVLIWASRVARILMMLGHRKGTGRGKMTTELNSDHRSVTALAYPLLFNLVNYKSCFTSNQALSK